MEPLDEKANSMTQGPQGEEWTHYQAWENCAYERKELRKEITTLRTQLEGAVGALEKIVEREEGPVWLMNEAAKIARTALANIRGCDNGMSE